MSGQTPIKHEGGHNNAGHVWHSGFGRDQGGCNNNQFRGRHIASTNLTKFKGRISGLEGHSLGCTHAINTRKMSHSMEVYANYIAIKLTSGRAEVKFTIMKENKYPSTNQPTQRRGRI